MTLPLRHVTLPLRHVTLQSPLPLGEGQGEGSTATVRPIRIALGQMNATVGDLHGNAERMLALVHEAREQQADLVAFPELALTGYPPEDLLFKRQFLLDARDPTGAAIAEAAQRRHGRRGRPRTRGRRALPPRRGALPGPGGGPHLQRRRRPARRRRCCGLPQDTPAQPRRVRRAALLRARQRVPRLRDQRRADGRQRLRGHLVRHRPRHRAAARGRGGRRHHQRLAVPPGALRPAQRDALPPRPPSTAASSPTSTSPAGRTSSSSTARASSSTRAASSSRGRRSSRSRCCSWTSTPTRSAPQTRRGRSRSPGLDSVGDAAPLLPLPRGRCDSPATPLAPVRSRRSCTRSRRSTRPS